MRFNRTVVIANNYSKKGKLNRSELFRRIFKFLIVGSVLFYFGLWYAEKNEPTLIKITDEEAIKAGLPLPAPKEEAKPAAQAPEKIPLNILEFRRKYPEYNDLSDDELSIVLHKKYFSNIPYYEFKKSFIKEKTKPTAIQSVPTPDTAAPALKKSEKDWINEGLEFVKIRYNYHAVDAFAKP